MAELSVIARIETGFPAKFGVPRQSGLVPSLRGKIVFEAPFRDPDFIRGIEGFSHLWLLFRFDGVERGHLSATVRPPRLGGNRRVGVFASRSPFRPNPIGLSSVRLEGMEEDGERGTVLLVSGADLTDGTAIYDIKPYLSFTDSHPDAADGFAGEAYGRFLTVEIPDSLLARISADERDAVRDILAGDPRPSYQDDPERVYGFSYAGMEIRFRVSGSVATVTEVVLSPAPRS